MAPSCDTSVCKTKKLNIKNHLLIMTQTTSDNEGKKVINYYEGEKNQNDYSYLNKNLHFLAIL